MDPAERSRWFRRHPRTALLVFAAAMIGVLDLALGSLLHGLGVPLPGQRPDARFRARHDVYHHGLRPSASEIGMWGANRYPVYTDDLGFKSASVGKTPLTSDGYRVLVLGDSFTEGVGMAYEDTFVGLANARLADRDIELLNAGVSSYSPVIYWKKAEHLLEVLGLRVDRVLVFIDLSDVRDEVYRYSLDADGRVLSARDREPRRVIERFLQDHTILVGGIREMNRRRGRASRGPEPREVDDERASWTYLDSAWEESGRLGVARETDHMDALLELLTARSIPLAIAVYPWPDQILGRHVDDRQVAHWRAWAAERDVAFLDCYPDFIDGTPPEEVVAETFIPGDVHWSRPGHVRIADRIVAYFADLER